MSRARSLPLLLLLLAATAGCASGGSGASVRIEGERAVSEATLLDAARRELAAFERQERRADLADAAYMMERALRERGHAEARVQLDDADAAAPVFVVEEGPRVQVERVTFSGDPPLAPERLAELARLSGSGLLRTGRPVYRSDEIETIVRSVESAGLVLGYRDIRVGPAALEWNEARDSVSVDIPVDAGRRWTIRQVRVEGPVPGVDVTRLVDELGLIGAPYHVRRGEEVAGRVRRVLLDRGHAFAEIEARTELDAETGQAVVVVTSRPGPVARLSRIDIEGLDRTRAGFVRDRVPLQQDDPVAKSAVDRAVRDLYATGIFRSVRTAIEREGSKDAGVVPARLGLSVEELPSRHVEFELGWGSYELARARASYRDRNLAGTGRLLDVSVFGSTKGGGAQVRGEDRHLLGPAYRLEVQIGYEAREEPAFDLREGELVASVRRDLERGRYWKAGYELRGREARAIEGRVLGAEESGFERSAGVFATLGIDRRDDALFPTDGWLAEIGGFLSTPALGAELHFVEWQAKTAWYHALDEDTVLALGARTTLREVLDTRTTLPVQERLFLGGEGSVRSFREDELGPFDAERDPVGGLTRAQLNAEVRRRITGDLWTALFYDVGTVSEQEYDYRAGTGSAVGIGLRYTLPVGPVRLDLGYNPGRRFAADRSWALHLSFGFSF